MFYTLDLSKELEIPPRVLGPKLREEIYERLRQDVEGLCDGKHGFILAVTSLYSVGQGLIREGVGNALFNVQYRCIAFMPHKGEVLDATVKSVNKVGDEGELRDGDDDAHDGLSLERCWLLLLLMAVWVK